MNHIIKTDNYKYRYIKTYIAWIGTDLPTLSTYKFKRAFFRHERRNAPKFGTHVRMETRLALTKKNCPNPTPEGFRGLFMFVACGFVGCLWVAFSTRTSDRAQIWHACADGDETGSHQKNWPTPPQRGLGGYLCLWHVGLWDVCGWHDSSRW